jgi:hypothetical protein
MTDIGHACPAPTCPRSVPLDRYACPVHWRRLPSDLQLAVVIAWGRRRKGVEGAKEAHEAAKAAADKWLADHAGAAT